MHSKTHFKSLFKSAKISTVSAKIIFLLNTTLPSEHYKIYFINLGATKLEIWKSQKKSKTGIKWVSLQTRSRWPVGPGGQGTPHVIDSKQGRRRCTLLAWPELADGEVAGGDVFARWSTEQRASNNLGDGSRGWAEHARRRWWRHGRGAQWCASHHRPWRSQERRATAPRWPSEPI